MKKRNWLALLLCLMLPVSAMAVTEGVVEEAPMVDVQTTAQEVSYLPDASYYAMDTWKPDWEESEICVVHEQDTDGYFRQTSQNPCLTAGEIRRAQKLLADYQAENITYTGESVLEKMNSVIVGVYALNPADYDGEKAFVILPGTCLNDEQLLSIIAAYDEMGLVFDPSNLNYRNCARGGGIETTRFFVDEERERYLSMADAIKRGQLVPPAVLGGTIRNPKLQSEYFNGLEDFSINPYRAMTDEELISLLVAVGVHDESGEIDHNDVESRARTALYTKLGCPLSMKLEYVFPEGSYAPECYTADGAVGHDYTDSRAAYGACFSYHNASGDRVSAIVFYDKATDALVSLAAMPHSNNQYMEISDVVTQEKIDAAIVEVEERLKLSSLKWHTVWDNTTTTNWGLCVPVRAQVEEGWFLTIYIGGDDGCEHGLELSKGTLVDEIPAADLGPNG